MITTTITSKGETITTDTDSMDRLARTVRADGLPSIDDGVAANREIRRQLAGRLRPPADDDFDDTGILDSHDMERLAEQMIADYPELSHIGRVTVKYAWRAKGGKSKGVPVHGRCMALTSHTKHFADADFLILLSADCVRDAAYGPEQIEALLMHELLHIGQELDQDEGSPTYGELTIKAVGHDAELFWAELARFGAWRDALRTTINTVEQLQLRLGAA